MLRPSAVPGRKCGGPRAENTLVDPLDVSHPARRRYAALLLDIDRLGGRVSDQDLALRGALYGLSEGYLGSLLMSAEPLVLTREPSGWWGLTAAGRQTVDRLAGGTLSDLARAAGVDPD